MWFAPKAPAGHETNWVQDQMPGRGWNTLLRLYAPGDFELVDETVQLQEQVDINIALSRPSPPEASAFRVADPVNAGISDR